MDNCCVEISVPMANTEEIITKIIVLKKEAEQPINLLEGVKLAYDFMKGTKIEHFVRDFQLSHYGNIRKLSRTDWCRFMKISKFVSESTKYIWLAEKISE